MLRDMTQVIGMSPSQHNFLFSPATAMGPSPAIWQWGLWDSSTIRDFLRLKQLVRGRASTEMQIYCFQILCSLPWTLLPLLRLLFLFSVLPGSLLHPLPLTPCLGQTVCLWCRPSFKFIPDVHLFSFLLTPTRPPSVSLLFLYPSFKFPLKHSLFIPFHFP